MASFKRISLIIQKNYELLQRLEVQISHYLKMFSFSTTQKKKIIWENNSYRHSCLETYMFSTELKPQV